MIERDMDDSFPESDFATWTCPICGAQHQGAAGPLEVAECPAIADARMDVIDSDWFDILDPVERKVG